MRYGAKNARWAPWQGDEPEQGMPLYGKTEDMGGINESNDTINFAEASGYADNGEKVKVKEFANGTIDAKMLAVPFPVGSAILGTATHGQTGRAYGGDDHAPFGGYGFYSCYIDGANKRTYTVIFYPKVQGSTTGSNYKTKEDQIALEYDAISFNILLPKCGKYKVEEQFDTEEEAQEYLDGLFAGTSVVAGVAGSGVELGSLTVQSAAGTSEGDTKLTVTEGKLAETDAYKYRVGDHEEAVKYGEDVSGWTAWDGQADVKAATGMTLTLVECDDKSKAVAAGHCTVTANDGE